MRKHFLESFLKILFVFREREVRGERYVLEARGKKQEARE